MDWINFKLESTGGVTRVPDQPGVRDAYEARGWVEFEPEAEGPFVPPKAVETNEEDGWVTLYHPSTHAAHDFPSHPDAIQGAYDAGWQVSPPKAAEPVAPETPEETPQPVGDSVKSKPAKKAESADNQNEVTRG